MRNVPLTVYLLVAFVTLVVNFFFVQRHRARQSGERPDTALALFGAVGVAALLMVPLFYMLYIVVGSPLFRSGLLLLQLVLTYGWAHLAAYALRAGRDWLAQYLPGLAFLLNIPLLLLFARLTTDLFPYKWWTLATWLLFFAGAWPWLRVQRRTQEA